MDKINELRAMRAKTWDEAKAFLDSRRSPDGILSAEDTETYERMEEKISSLGKEIDRQSRLDEIGREMERPVNTPITTRPGDIKPVKETKTGRASDEYKKAFWAQTRSKELSPELRNALQEGVNSEGGYLVPDEFEHTLIQGLEEQNVIRARAHIITTSNGLHKIPVVTSKGTAAWIDEEGQFTESDDVFGQAQLDAHKVGTIIKVSQELLQDSAFPLEKYFVSEFARRIGGKEEEAFITGNGTGKPTGLLDATGGGQVGVTASKTNEISADEFIDLYYSLKAPYRKNAVWVLNDSTVKAIRKLKDGSGQYLWQPAIRDGEVNTILGRPYITSQYMPEIEAEAKTVMFGDLSYYWIGDRLGVTFQKLNERFADYGQVGFLAYRRVDGKLILPEAVKILQMKA